MRVCFLQYILRFLPRLSKQMRRRTDMELRRRIIEASKRELQVRKTTRINDSKHNDLRRSLDNLAARKALALQQMHQTHPAASSAAAAVFQSNRNTMMVSQSQPALQMSRVGSGGIIRRRGLPCTQSTTF